MLEDEVWDKYVLETSPIEKISIFFCIVYGSLPFTNEEETSMETHVFLALFSAWISSHFSILRYDF